METAKKVWNVIFNILLVFAKIVATVAIIIFGLVFAFVIGFFSLCFRISLKGGLFPFNMFGLIGGLWRTSANFFTGW